MSYYSDVAIVISQQDHDRLRKALPIEGLVWLQRADIKRFKRADGAAWVLIQWTDERWYSGHDTGIDAIEAFIADVPHEFLRTGEEFVDVEHENTSDYLDVCDVVKTIVFYP